MIRYLLLGLALLIAGGSSSFGTALPDDSTNTFDTGELSFAVQVNDDVVPYRIMGVFVMPESEIAIQVDHGPSDGDYTVMAEEGTLAPITNRKWHWFAPSTPGLYPLHVTEASTGQTMQLNVFVLTPFRHDSPDLDGFRIGEYREKALRGMDTYERPEGFVQVTEANRTAKVAPHFTLEQFLCKQTDGYPQYALLRTELLLKLERVLEGINASGHAVSTLHVMSGFRTPYYNRSIGNTTDYSRHLYGGAADVFVDAAGDGWMDDLDGDGQVTEADAEVMAGIVQEMAEEVEVDWHVGGLGIYGPAPHRGPFIHVDARGYEARW